MSKFIKCFFITLFILFSFKSSILAIDCIYPDAGLTITYDENGAKINSDFVKSKYYLNTLIFGTSQSSTVTNEINIDQSLWEKYKGVACPSGMKVCTSATYSFDLPTLKGLGAGIADGFVNNALMAPHISDDVKNWTGENSYNLLNFDVRKLYVLTKEEYDNSEIRNYHNGINFTNTFKENYDLGYKGCNGEAGGGWIALGFLCGLGTEIGVTVWDLFAEDISVAKVIDLQCQDVTYNGQYASFNVNCGQLMNKMVQYMDKVSNYKNCGSENELCKSKAITDINEVEDNIKSQCKSILQHHDFEGVQKECIENCLNMKDILNGYKQGTDLFDDGTTGQCGFSDRLLIWIGNIVRWIKYIIPAIVIVLGILDFIKAIASDKDDEMKKAQGRFIKRLIAAALIFIVPFIIEFILDKMGFASNGCGIIDL